MIKKPQNYENLKNSFESLNAGGHKCVIMEAKEDKDPNGRDILRVSFDTANDDTQPKYFSNLYIKDTRPDKKWSYSGQKTFWQDSEWFESNLSKMTGAIEKSNPDVEIWNNGVLDLAKLKGLKVGIVFGIEDYIKEDHSLGASCKPRYFCGYDEAFQQAIPKKKDAKPRAEAPTIGDYGFVNVAEEDTEGLPFK